MSDDKAEEGVLVAEGDEEGDEEVEYEEVEEEVEETEDPEDEHQGEKIKEEVQPDAAEEALGKEEKKEVTELPAQPMQAEIPPPSLAPTAVDKDISTVTSASNVAPGDLQHQIEQQAAKVAAAVMATQVQVQGLFSAAFAGVSSEAPNLTRLAGGLTEGLASWWGSSSEAPRGQDNEMSLLVQSSSSKATSELASLFGLSPDENLVETFKCKLIQTYGCQHNAYTPAIQMAFQGTLYITDRHTCFSIEERNRKLPFKIAHSSIEKAVRMRPQRKGDLSDVLKLTLKPTGGVSGQFISLKDFETSNLDSALALIEHLMSEVKV